MKLDLDLLSNHLFIIKKLQRTAFRRLAGELEGKILDVGSGPSPYCRFLKECTCVRVDVSAAGGPDALAQADALPFASASFDGAVCTEVLEHLRHPQRALDEINRVLGQGGMLYLTAPQTWGLHYEPYDYWRFTRHGLRALLKDAGFELLRKERIGGICSMTGARVIDVCWILLTKIFSFCGSRWAEKISTLLCLPGSVLLYAISLLADRISNADALGWAMLAKKRS